MHAEKYIQRITTTHLRIYTHMNATETYACTFGVTVAIAAAAAQQLDSNKLAKHTSILIFAKITYVFASSINYNSKLNHIALTLSYARSSRQIKTGPTDVWR